MIMKRHKEKLDSVYQTSGWMVKLIKKFNADVSRYDDYDFLDFYYMVRQLPYIDDGHDERISRPKWTLMDNPEFRDCDDKAIIIGCWLYRQDIPFRILACSYEPGDEIHHCILQTQKPRMFIDATYPDEDDFPPTKRYYNILPLSGWVSRSSKLDETAAMKRNNARLVAGRQRSLLGKFLGCR